MKYYYIDHMGGIYDTDEPRDVEDLHCEQCGDYDVYLGLFVTSEEAYKAYCEYCGSSLTEEEEECIVSELLEEEK